MQLKAEVGRYSWRFSGGRIRTCETSLFHGRTSSEAWIAIERAGLKTGVTGLPAKLVCRRHLAGSAQGLDQVNQMECGDEGESHQDHSDAGEGEEVV